MISSVTSTVNTSRWWLGHDVMAPVGQDRIEDLLQQGHILGLQALVGSLARRIPLCQQIRGVDICIYFSSTAIWHYILSDNMYVYIINIYIYIHVYHIYIYRWILTTDVWVRDYGWFSDSSPTDIPPCLGFTIALSTVTTYRVVIGDHYHDLNNASEHHNTFETTKHTSCFKLAFIKEEHLNSIKEN